MENSIASADDRYSGSIVTEDAVRMVSETPFSRFTLTTASGACPEPAMRIASVGVAATNSPGSRSVRTFSRVVPASSFPRLIVTSRQRPRSAQAATSRDVPANDHVEVPSCH